MENEFTNVNWLAVLVGTASAYALGMVWFSQRMFGKGWAAASHNLQPPASAPVAALLVQLAGTFMMALFVGLTETRNMLITAIVGILAVAVVVAGMDLFSQKGARAVWIDAGFVVAMGVLMILVQAIL